MTHFTYTAKGSNGAEKSGYIDAMSLQAARDQILAMGLDPIEIYETPPASVKPSKPAPNTAYLPMFETLRLYAGWLLAWYALVYIIGSYQFSKSLPFRIPYAESLFLSPLVLSFTFAAFLFLLLSSLYKHFGRNKIIGIFLTAIGVCIFLLYRMNVQ
jgi:hypothetical protein